MYKLRKEYPQIEESSTLTFNLAFDLTVVTKYVIVPVTCELHTIRTSLGIVILLMELRVSSSIVLLIYLEYLLIPA